jgi:WhiB family transcriptional regulator, redox-sensing transcriptional regulator
MTIDLAAPADTRANARPFASFQMRADVRLFQTSQPLACQEDPELFFDPRAKHRAIKRCVECPFRGRCGYNAVATGATHGIWGGVILPGDFPKELKPIYARLAAQFEQRRQAELGDLLVAPLPDLIDDETGDDEPLTFHVDAA